MQFIFTNCGKSGRYGPSQSDVDKEYEDTNLEGQVKSYEGIQRWKIPVDGIYKITVFGASGGSSISSNTRSKGAIVQGYFNLKHGDFLRILVGQEPSNTSGRHGAGGTFVTKESIENGDEMYDGTKVSPILIAGGGGGVHDTHGYQEHGRMGTSGGNAYVSGSLTASGGSNGHGGSIDNSGGNRGAGSGWLTRGAGSSGQTFLDGGNGNGSGGFGCAGNDRSGAGGYSGGAGGAWGSNRVNGGGGSFIHYSAINPATSNGNWSTTGDEPHDVYDGNVSSLNRWNSNNPGLVIITLVEKRNKVFFDNYKNLMIKSYPNILKNISNAHKNNHKLKVALFNDGFNNSLKNNSINDLKGEIKDTNYYRNTLDINGLYLKDDKLKLKTNKVVWENVDIKARYGVVYVEDSGDLLFQIDFNEDKTSNSNKEFTISFQDNVLLNLYEDNRLDLDLLSVILGENYSQEDIAGVIRRNFDKIKNNKTIIKTIFSHSKTLKAVLNSGKFLNKLDFDLLKFMLEEQNSFNNSINKHSSKSILDLIVDNNRVIYNLTRNNSFVDKFIKRSDLIIKKCKKETIEHILQGVIDNNPNKLNEAYEKYGYYIDNNDSLYGLYNVRKEGN